MQQPHEYSRRVLLCVIGMTPQLVTETLYKLTQETDPAYIPTEIHLITTGEGKRSAQNALLGVEGQRGEFYNFCHDYSMPEIDFRADNIHVISGPDGLFIDDAQYSKQNTITANYITETVRQFTEDNDCSIHLSLAGGRKTMSYYGGYALSLFGRLQDRLSHVLVAKPFQENEKFFYPPPKAKRLAVKNVHYSTDEANIILSDIAFVRLRKLVPDPLLKEGKAGFQETVEAIQRFAQPETIEINVGKKKVLLNGMKVEMDDANLAVYLWMCERVINNESPFIPDEDAFVEDYISVYARVIGAWNGRIDRVEKVSLNRTATQQKDWFLSRKSKLKNAISSVLGNRAAQPFLIQTVDYSGHVAYRIKMNPETITIQ